MTFWAQICPKMDFGVKILKIKSGFRISILKLLCVPIFRHKGNLKFLGPNLPKNQFWGQNFKNLSLDSESGSLRYYEHQFSENTDNFEFLGPNLSKNGFWGRNFKNLSLDSKSTPSMYHVCQFSVKVNNF